MTLAVVHLWRLFRWGRILSKHGILKAAENSTTFPFSFRFAIKLLQLGGHVENTPDYAGAFVALGPSAIKFGQTLATRPDLIGDAAANQLACLQDSVPPLPFKDIRPVIENTLGCPIEKSFRFFNEIPIGSASIAQVYQAETLDGDMVAVKVLRPGIKQAFRKTTETYEWTASKIESWNDEFIRLRPKLVVKTFRQWTIRELDLRREAASASELAENMGVIPDFKVPAIDWSRTSQSMMTMQWIDGIKLSDHQKLKEAGYDLKSLATRLVRSFLRQAIADGFFHADLHHGNLFALKDGSLAVVDFGIMGRIDKKARRWLAEILYGLIAGNYSRIAEIHFEAGYVPPHHDMAEFTTALRAIGEPIRGLSVRDISISHMLDGLFAITREFEMQTQPHLLLLQKTMVVVEGVATSLYPDINLWDTAEPFVREWLRSELGPEAKIAEEFHKTLNTMKRLPDIIDRMDQYYPHPTIEEQLYPVDNKVPVKSITGHYVSLITLAAFILGIVLGHHHFF
ncbi:2-polyprenylphenol 6-hydroxylase [Zymomonas sp.]|uniref:2-polyprenylphenol 6-hydroxylase n=1 Tax=Zymomonas sp. TaxID=2068624 RepID=UPI0025CF91C4|nr:2-polyprenylphenol 6-hydroxylase [Zymomonas sp.]MCA1955322.1 2-polyprenylphenol 6-hydroxylase [Zymomonas sp.]